MNTLKRAAILIFLVNLPAVSTGRDDRYFDAPDRPEIMTVVVLHPVPGVVRTLIGLREQGLLPREGIRFVGVYHEKEKADGAYRKAAAFVEPLFDWFFFHRITAPLHRDSLYMENACSADFDRIFSGSDAVILFGGDDIPPAAYGSGTRLLTDIQSPFRHYLELSLVFHLLGGYQDGGFLPLLERSLRFPVLGMCLGAQTLNTGTGGTLVQDIWSGIYGKDFYEDVLRMDRDRWHKNPWKPFLPEENLFSYFFHPVRLDPESPFVKEMGFKPSDTPLVMSAHHQAADKLGRGFRIAAVSMDGRVVEAIAHTRYPNVLGVQFHPENPVLWNPRHRVRLLPEDEGVNVRKLLEDHSPSYAFQRSIWLWFTEKVRAHHRERTGKR